MLKSSNHRGAADPFWKW